MLGGRRVAARTPLMARASPPLSAAMACAPRSSVFICSSPASVPAGGGSRNMAEVDATRGTVFLNAAVVPRIRSLPQSQCSAGSGSASSEGGDSSGGSSSSNEEGGARVRAHHFLVVELRQQVVTAARDVWVGVQPADQPGDAPRCAVLREQPLLRTAFPPSCSAAGEASEHGTEAAAGQSATAAAAEAAALEAASADSDGSRYVCSIYRAHTGEWEPFVLQAPPVAQPAPK